MLVKEGCSEWKWLILSSCEIKPNLAEAKKVEVIDEKGADENDPKPEQTNSDQNVLKRLRLHSPHHAAHRLPKPEKQQQTDAC